MSAGRDAFPPRPSGIRTRVSCLLLLALAVSMQTARAESFPDQPLRMLVPFAAGGPVDTIGRILARTMSDTLKQAVIVENRPGASGVIAMEALVRGRPDGYTMIFTSIGALVLLPHTLQNLPYDPERDIRTISIVVTMPRVLVVRKDSPARDLDGFIDLGRTSKGITFASPGIGTSQHLTGESLRLRSGANLIHVPYRGAAPAITDLLGGQVEMAVLDLPGVLPQIQQGQIRALAIASPDRNPSLPDVPTLAEAGYGDTSVDLGYAIMVPAATPPDRVAILQRAISATLAQSAVRNLITQQGGVIRDIGPEEAARELQRQFALWGDLVRALPSVRQN